MKIVWPSLDTTKQMARTGVPFSMICYLIGFVAAAGWRRGIVAYLVVLAVSSVGGGIIGGFYAWQDAQKRRERGP